MNTPKLLGKKGTVFFSIVLVVFAVVSFFGAIRVGNIVENYQKQLLTDRIETAVLSINADLIKNLSVTKKDTTTEEYKILKNSLRAIKNANGDARFVYIMRKHPSQEKLQFLVDAEDESSPDYSNPGDIYNETTQVEIKSLLDKKVLITQPTKDRWGTWVTAEIPILDPISSSPIALLGMDISADVWKSEILFAQSVVGVVGLLVFCVMLIFYVALKKSKEEVAVLSEANTVLATEKKELKEAESIAGIGKWVLIPQSDEMLWNEKMYEIAEIEQGTKVNKDSLKNIIHPNDRENVFQTIDATIDSNQNECSIEYRIVTANRHEKNLLSLCRIYRKEDGSPSKIICTTQDITSR